MRGVRRRPKNASGRRTAERVRAGLSGTPARFALATDARRTRREWTEAKRAARDPIGRSCRSVAAAAERRLAGRDWASRNATQVVSEGPGLTDYPFSITAKPCPTTRAHPARSPISIAALRSPRALSCAASKTWRFRAAWWAAWSNMALGRKGATSSRWGCRRNREPRLRDGRRGTANGADARGRPRRGPRRF